MSAREEVGSVGEDGERRKEEEKEFVEIERRGGARLRRIGLAKNFEAKFVDRFFRHQVFSPTF